MFLFQKSRHKMVFCCFNAFAIKSNQAFLISRAACSRYEKVITSWSLNERSTAPIERNIAKRHEMK